MTWLARAREKWGTDNEIIGSQKAKGKTGRLLSGMENVMPSDAGNYNSFNA